jgi:hypothetical protein
VSPRGQRRALGAGLAATALALWACLAPSGAKIERQLAPGLPREEVLLLLAEGARIESHRRVLAPVSGDWEDVVDDRGLLGAILTASVRVDVPIAEFDVVRRARGLEADDFLLFFDQYGLLVYHQRRPAR